MRPISRLWLRETSHSKNGPALGTTNVVNCYLSQNGKLQLALWRMLPLFPYLRDNASHDTGHEGFYPAMLHPNGLRSTAVGLDGQKWQANIKSRRTHVRRAGFRTD